MLLLDTHVWIWLNEGSFHLVGAIRDRIDEAARHGEARVSVISIWEVGLLFAKRRVDFGGDCREWVRRALAPPLAPVALTAEIALECHLLPGRLHDDPADRIVAATARVEGMTLVTRDRRLLAYAGQGHLRALAC